MMTNSSKPRPRAGRPILTLKPRLRELGTILEEKIKRAANPSGRDADSRRTIPLNSSAWRKLRARVLAEEPLCRMCKARDVVTAATNVDHVSGDPSDNSRRNLQALCHECHSHKTGRERAGLQAIHGHDVEGMPLDPAHPWNTPRGTEKSPAGDGPKTVRPPSLQRNGRE